MSNKVKDVFLMHVLSSKMHIKPFAIENHPNLDHHFAMCSYFLDAYQLKLLLEEKMVKVMNNDINLVQLANAIEHVIDKEMYNMYRHL